MIVPLKTKTPTTILKRGIQPMNSQQAAQQAPLSHDDLTRRINDLINLNELATISLAAPDGQHAAGYALKQIDGKLAELHNYLCEQAQARQPVSSIDIDELENDANTLFDEAHAQLVSMTTSRSGEGFFALIHRLASAYLASVHKKVSRLHQINKELLDVIKGEVL